MGFIAFIKRNPILIALLLLSILFGKAVLWPGSEIVDENPDELLKSVELIKASEMVEGGVLVSSLGTVQSVQEVEIKAETSGTILNLPVKKGDKVERGQLLMELNYDILDARVQQAEAALASAQASLQKIKNGERAEDIAILEQQLEAARQRYKQLESGAREEEIQITETQIKTAKSSLEDAEKNLKNIIKQADQDIENAIQNSLNALFQAVVTSQKVMSQNLQDIIHPIRVPETETCRLKIISTANQSISQVCFNALRTLENIEEEISEISETSDADMVIEKLNKAKTGMLTIRSFMDKLLNEVNAAISIIGQGQAISSDQLTTFKNSITSAQNEFEGVFAQVTAAQNALLNQQVISNNAITNAQTTVNDRQGTVLNLEKELVLQKNGARAEDLAIQQSEIRQLELRVSLAKKGNRIEDIRSQEAAVLQAGANLAEAQANRNRASIVSPFDGTIIQFPVELGDSIAAGNTVAMIARAEKLEVKSFITEEERFLVRQANTAIVRGTDAQGEVSEVAIALEQDTKKLEVIINLTEGFEDLVLGQTVFIDFEVDLNGEDKTLRIPLTAVKVLADKAVVFTVDSVGMIEELEVEVGQVYGDTVLVKGLDANTYIIPDVTSLEGGEKVTTNYAE